MMTHASKRLHSTFRAARDQPMMGAFVRGGFAAGQSSLDCAPAILKKPESVRYSVKI